jgi:hypothetical protein
MLIRDNQTGEVSNVGKTTFQLVNTASENGEEFAAQGNVEIPQTYSFDLDQGIFDTDSGDDIWFQAVTQEERYLTPISGVKLSEPQNEKPTKSDCKNLTLTGERKNVNNLDPNDWICVYTSEGRYSRLQILEVEPDPGSIELSYATWDK